MEDVEGLRGLKGLRWSFVVRCTRRLGGGVNFG
jgi:hypothetical protein